jgi:hypothetical protein
MGKNEGAIQTVGEIYTGQDLYIDSGVINTGSQTPYLFSGAETVSIGNLNNGSVEVGLLNANSSYESAIFTNGGIIGNTLTTNSGYINSNVNTACLFNNVGAVNLGQNAQTIYIGNNPGTLPDPTINLGNVYTLNTLINLFANIFCQGSLTLDGALNSNQAVSIFNTGAGYESGQIFISQPFQGQSLKITVIICVEFTTNGNWSCTYNYPTPYSYAVGGMGWLWMKNLNAPYDENTGISSSNTQLSIQIPSGRTTNNVIIIIGR